MVRTRAADKKSMKSNLLAFMKIGKGFLQKVTTWMMILMMFLSISVSADADITSIIFTSHDDYELVPADSNLKIRWSKVSGALSYMYAVRDLTTDTKLIDNEYTSNPYFTIRSNLLTANHDLKIWVGAYTERYAEGSMLSQGLLYLTTQNVIYAPTVETIEAEYISTTTAMVGIDLQKNGGADVMDCGIYWGYSRWSINRQFSFGAKYAEKGIFQQTLTGLDSAATVYYKAYATNKIGTSYGDVVSFTTRDPITAPTVVTLNAADISTSTATVGIDLQKNGGADVTDCGICWGYSSTSLNNCLSFGAKYAQKGPFKQSLTGLNAGTTVYYQAYATNKVGTNYGSVVSFTTRDPITAPTVVTLNAADVSTSTATVGIDLQKNGGADVTDCGIYWGYSSTSLNNCLSFGAKYAQKGPFKQSLTGLNAGTTVYYQAYATNKVGTNYGSVVNFTTRDPITAPTVVTLNAADISTSTATVGIDLQKNGGADVTDCGIYWGYSSTSLNNCLSFGAKYAQKGPFKQSLTGLNAGTTVYYQAYATNKVGTNYGSVLSFTTKALPTAAPTNTPEPTKTPEPTRVPQPTQTPEPTRMPQPTQTPEPTRVPQPTNTPEPTTVPQPTNTPEPTIVPEPTGTPEPTEKPVLPEVPTPTNTPAPQLPDIVMLTGKFKRETKTLKIGETWQIEGKVSLEGGSGYLGKITIDSPDVTTKNLMTGNFKAYKMNSVKLQDWKAFKIDTTKAPWNKPGTYTLRLWAKDTKGNGGENALATMKLIIKGEEPTFTGKFKRESKTLTIGETWLIEGTVSVEGGSGYLGKITINSPDVKTNNRMSDNFKDHKTDFVKLQEWKAFEIDTTKAPWNKPGTYTLRLWAKDTKGNGGDKCLDTMKIEIKSKEEPGQKNKFNPLWPCKSSYTITCLYSYKNGKKHSTRYETGIDIGGSGDILATEDGIVITAETLSGSFGNYVVIEHKNGMVSLYGHLKSRKVEAGDTVTRGQKIGVMGDSGNADGVHLHFELANPKTRKGDPWKTYFRSRYVKKLIYHKNCYLNNNPEHCKNWILEHCYLDGSYYYPNK